MYVMHPVLPINRVNYRFFEHLVNFYDEIHVCLLILIEILLWETKLIISWFHGFVIFD